MEGILRGRRVPGLGRPFVLLLAMLAGVLVRIASSPALWAADPQLTLPLPIQLNITLPVIGTITGSGGGGGGGASTSPPPTKRSPRPTAPRSGNPFRTRAMWIWELPASSGGNLGQIIATARYYGVRTLIIKSSDGTNWWGQYSRPLVSTLRAAGLRVCAWQYVYGQAPADEARLGANAVREGASCLVIDAESEYEGLYYAAQRYISRLRAQVGANFPIALAGFPYIDYHPAFPYSVFLGPGGAQYNIPQMYWREIGVTVDQVYSHTYAYNRLYRRPIYPLGQLYNRPPVRQIIRFRQLAAAYGARGVSWWDYQEATRAGWRGIAVPTARLAGFVPDPQLATLSRGWKGDPVVWAQELLCAAGDRVAVDGDFGRRTEAAVASFQAAHGLPATGMIDAGTWSVLLKYKPIHVSWARPSKKRGARAATVSTLTPPPQSASLPGRNEFRAPVGRGH